MTGEKALPVLRMFRGLAEDLGARSIRPLPDGTLLIVFSGRPTLRDGTALFGSRADVRATVAWHPSPPPGRPPVPGIGGGIYARGIDAAAADRVVARMITSCPAHALGTMRPFSIRSGPPRAIELGPRFVEDALGNFLVEGRSVVGAWLLEPVRVVAEGVIRLRFSSGGAGVEFEVRDASAGRDGDDVVGPLSVRRAEDDRPTADREPHDLVREYLLYALHRSVGPDDATRLPPPPRPEPEPEPDPLSADAPLSDRDLLDRRDQNSPWAFFIRPEDRSTGSMEAVTTLAEADEGLGVVGYTHPSCYTKVPTVRLTGFAGAMWQGFSELPLSVPRKPMGLTLPSEVDLILGRDAEYRFRLRAALRRPGTRMLVLFSTCVADLVGLDVEGIAAEEAAGTGVPTLAWTASPSYLVGSPHFWERLFSLARRDVAPVPGRVNLVGFAPEGSRVARELASDLATLGVRVAGFALPSFRTPHAERFLEAAVTVVSADRLVGESFSRVEAALAPAAFDHAAPPFGPAASLRFLRRVAERAGVEIPPGLEDAAWEPHRPEWDRLRERAARHEVAIVLRPRDAHCLTDPRQLYGLDLVAAVSEMGFRTNVVVVGDDETGEEPEAAAAALSARLASGGHDAVRVGCAVAAGVATPSEVIAGTGASVAFTEYPPDGRVTGSDRMSFHPRDFEMGLPGAVRTLRRLVRLAEGGFFRTFPGRAREETA